MTSGEKQGKGEKFSRGCITVCKQNQVSLQERKNLRGVHGSKNATEGVGKRTRMTAGLYTQAQVCRENVVHVLT